jgi:hypothetical protein
VDRAQRDVTIALMKEVLATDNDRQLREWGEELLGKLNGLADLRNIATHTMWAVMMPQREVTPHPHMPRHKLLQEDFRTQFENLTTKLSKLFRDLLQFDAALRAHRDSASRRS